ncbi:MAG: DNA topoisomerase (ATP-hydrolyzing) subunit A [Sandaracinaceae bacterium]
MDGIVDASLAEETRKRYLSYALSVITARALPDVRDGLKPVQRRILYTMGVDLRLRPDAAYMKCARVVGDVMGKYHPHGDSAIYDALARLAQGFTMRVPLVDGRGNFGSSDGDPPAAMRYTECRLTAVSEALLEELDRGTVDHRPTYDDRGTAPVILPAPFPNLLVNGAQGIAVGMATSIPPHNPAEVIAAARALIDDPNLTSTQLLVKHIKGPDFPTGGHVVSSRKELAAIYEAGQGTMKLRGEWTTEAASGRGNPKIVIRSIPYGVEPRAIAAKVAEIITARRLPVLVDVRDESTEDLRLVLEVKKGADPELVMAYLYKHTPLQSNVSLNLTCLVPTPGSDVARPERLSLAEALDHFLEFRMEVVTRRLEHDLRKLEERIHILEGFIKVFDALDVAIRLIRRSDGRKDASEKLQKKLELSPIQAHEILELRLYRLARLEIEKIRAELEDRSREARRLTKLLASDELRWGLIDEELAALQASLEDKRRTRVSGSTREPEYDAEAYIVDEDAVVLLSQQGWVKRQGSVSDIGATRVREGDAVQDVAAGSTKSAVAFFSNLGSCYVCRVVDVPATTGHGNPVQSLFKLADGERIVRMLGFDERVFDVPEPTEGAEEPEEPFAIAVTRGGMTTRFSLRAHREPSTRSGRRFMRLNRGDEVVEVAPSEGGHKVACATVKGYVLVTTDDEVPVLSGPGKGVRFIKLGAGDQVLAARVLWDTQSSLVVENDKGKLFEITVRRSAASRAGKGSPLFKRGRLVRAHPRTPTVPELNGS